VSAGSPCFSVISAIRNKAPCSHDSLPLIGGGKILFSGIPEANDFFEKSLESHGRRRAVGVARVCVIGSASGWQAVVTDIDEKYAPWAGFQARLETKRSGLKPLPQAEEDAPWESLQARPATKCSGLKAPAGIERRRIFDRL
jgi:hypothetical protein